MFGYIDISKLKKKLLSKSPALLVLNSSLCDSSVGYIHVKGAITVAEKGTNNAAIEADRNIKKQCLKIVQCLLIA